MEEIERKANTIGMQRVFFDEAGMGLTKREWFAGMALQGLIAGNGDENGIVSYDRHAIARTAVDTADDLLKRLAESDGAK